MRSLVKTKNVQEQKGEDIMGDHFEVKVDNESETEDNKTKSGGTEEKLQNKIQSEKKQFETILKGRRFGTKKGKKMEHMLQPNHTRKNDKR